MDASDFAMTVTHNRQVFDEILSSYVATKLERVLSLLPRGARSGWFDASGCVWCLFDDEGFERSGDAGQKLRSEQGKECPFQVYWSMGDVIMPGECSESWVAERIAEEAIRQLSSQGYRCKRGMRGTDDSPQLGVVFRKRLLSWW